jgi:hypothetical protein
MRKLDLKNNCEEIITLDKMIISAYSGKPVPLSVEGFHKIGAGIENPLHVAHPSMSGIGIKNLAKAPSKKKI